MLLAAEACKKKKAAKSTEALALLGGHAVFVNHYDRRFTVRGCHIAKAGANGVAFVEDRDAHSIIQDALFVDPAHGDYRVQDGSPARQLGFVNFPMAETNSSSPQNCRYGKLGPVQPDRQHVSPKPVYGQCAVFRIPAILTSAAELRGNSRMPSA